MIHSPQTLGLRLLFFLDWVLRLEDWEQEGRWTSMYLQSEYCLDYSQASTLLNKLTCSFMIYWQYFTFRLWPHEGFASRNIGRVRHTGLPARFILRYIVVANSRGFIRSTFEAKRTGVAPRRCIEMWFLKLVEFTITNTVLFFYTLLFFVQIKFEKLV